MRSAFFHFITTTGGPLSVKGRTRRAVEGWSRACDRCAKLAGMIGLQREQKVQSIDDWLNEPGDETKRTTAHRLTRGTTIATRQRWRKSTEEINGRRVSSTDTSASVPE